MTSRVCFYCKETVTPADDPFHVHGCTECQCGAKPAHNRHLHDRGMWLRRFWRWLTTPPATDWHGEQW